MVLTVICPPHFRNANVLQEPGDPVDVDNMNMNNLDITNVDIDFDALDGMFAHSGRLTHE